MVVVHQIRAIARAIREGAVDPVAGVAAWAISYGARNGFAADPSGLAAIDAALSTADAMLNELTEQLDAIAVSRQHFRSTRAPMVAPGFTAAVLHDSTAEVHRQCQDIGAVINALAEARKMLAGAAQDDEPSSQPIAH